MNKGIVFVIEDTALTRRTVADKLTITDAGWAKFWRGDKLVGVIRNDSWRRIYVEAPNAKERE